MYCHPVTWWAPPGGRHIFARMLTYLYHLNVSSNAQNTNKAHQSYYKRDVHNIFCADHEASNFSFVVRCRASNKEIIAPAFRRISGAQWTNEIRQIFSTIARRGYRWHVWVEIFQRARNVFLLAIDATSRGCTEKTVFWFQFGFFQFKPSRTCLLNARSELQRIAQYFQGSKHCEILHTGFRH